MNMTGRRSSEKTPNIMIKTLSMLKKATTPYPYYINGSEKLDLFFL